MTNPQLLEKLVAEVRQSGKYQHIAPELVRQIGQRELAAHGKLKLALKATKNKLHQVGGAYFAAALDYDQALAQLQAARGETAVWRAVCRQIMHHHTSTRERLPILDTFYATLLADLPPLQRVMDIACGLNPLAWPWLPFDDSVEYLAYDIYTDVMAFVQQFMALAAIRGRAEVRDVVSQPPTEPVDLVFLLKSVPCLAQLDKTAVPRLLDSLQTRYLVISFPVHSLGGRRKGMVATYEQQFHELAAGRNWQFRRFEFASELAFLIAKEDLN